MNNIKIWESATLTWTAHRPTVDFGLAREFFGERWVEIAVTAYVSHIGWFTVEGSLR